MALQKIGETLAVRFGIQCLAAPLVDTRPTEPGVQADCQVVDRVPVAGSFKDTPVPPCGSGAIPCWRLDTDVTCTQSGFRLSVDRGGGFAPPGALLNIKCLTCSRPDSFCCRR